MSTNNTEIDDLRRQAEHGSPNKVKTALGSAAGTCVENYDFVAYGTAAALYFGDVFFPESDPVTGTLLSFATLGVGFLMRPIGGSVGGYLADRHGRKPVLVGALLIMGIATVLIGLLPTYAQVGVLAPVLLVIIRMIQGLAFGAEWGGAVLMAYEHAPWRHRGRSPPYRRRATRSVSRWPTSPSSPARRSTATGRGESRSWPAPC